MASIHDQIKKLYAALNKDYLDAGEAFENDPRAKELIDLITSPEAKWAHYTHSPTYFEDTPGAVAPLWHVGTDQAADDRMNDIGDAFSGNDRIIPIQMRDIKNPAFIHDNGLGSPMQHYTAQFMHPDVKSYEKHQYRPDQQMVTKGPFKAGGPGRAPKDVFVDDPIIDIKDQQIAFDPNFRTHPDHVKAAKEVEKHYLNAGYDALVYPNSVEDPGSISMVPLKENTVFNSRTGKRIKQAAGTAGAAGLLAAGGSGSTEAEEFNPDAELAKLQLTHALVTGQGPEEEDPVEEMLRKATEEAYKETRPSVRMQALMEIMAFRAKLNSDIKDDPVRSAASIPVGAAEGMWDTANMLGRGWSWLNHKVDGTEEPTRMDDLLDWSEGKRENTRDFLTDKLGLPQSVRTVGEFTGAGGASTIGAKKAADTLYDIYRLGL